MTTISVNFKIGGDSEKLDINTNITIEQMINKFLEKKNLLNNGKRYSFMVNSTVLSSKKKYKKLVKHFPKIRPRCTITVRETDQIDGGIFF